MKKLLFTILFTLVLGAGASAEKISLNCKFLNGSVDDLKYKTSDKIDYQEDVIIDLDLKNNKVLNGPKLKLDSDTFFYNDNDEISWKSQLGDAMTNTVTLNRRNGNLKIWTFFKLKPDHHANAFVYYQCTKTDTKLF